MNRAAVVFLLVIFFIFPVSGLTKEPCQGVRSAIELRDYSKLRGFLHGGRSIRECDADNDLLVSAIEKDDRRMAEFLLANGADINKYSKNRKNWPVFHLDHRRIAMMKRMICSGLDLKLRSFQGTPLLEHFVWNDYDNRDEALGMVLVLLQAGANPNGMGEKNRTALFYAVQNSDSVTARALIDFGADVNRRDSDGRTPLFFAQDSNVAEVLIKNGALTSIQDRFSESLCVYYVNQHKSALLQTLVQRGLICIRSSQRDDLIALLKDMAGKEGRENATRLYTYLVQADQESGWGQTVTACGSEKTVTPKSRDYLPLSPQEIKSYEEMANAVHSKRVDLSAVLFDLAEIGYVFESRYDLLHHRFERFSDRSITFERENSDGDAADTSGPPEFSVRPAFYSDDAPFCHLDYKSGGQAKRKKIIDIDTGARQAVVYLGDGSELRLVKTDKKDSFRASGVLTGHFRRIHAPEGL